MSEPKLKLTADEFGLWLLPSQAVARLPWEADLARDTLLQHLQHEQVFAAPATASWFDDRGKRVEVPLSIIGSVWWRAVGGAFYRNPFWTTGTINFSRHVGRLNEEKMSCFGVRFDPAGIQAMILRNAGAVFTPASPIMPEPESAPAPAPSTAPEDHNRPPVAEAHLREWAALYKRVYGGKPEDTQDFAWLSARGMFPDKRVSRDRVRAAYGERPKGRKPEESAD